MKRPFHNRLVLYLWPLRLCRSSPVSALKRHTVLSSLPLATVFPSGLNVTDFTPRLHRSANDQHTFA